ncbi:MAG: valyl-tRNA synthetase, partial [Pseudomonadota bacterium]|nr:valyl-tRNA synthetase [Pseudomonadota bacterium]
DLESAGLLVEIKPHKLMVPRGDRTNTVIEPMLTNQWYVAMDKLAQTGLELVKDGAVKFVPDNWTVIYNQWLENIQDWCISRQLWWGHRIPAYYDKSGKYYVARTLADAISQAGTDNLTQDDDVLDTWFSSGLWCFSTLGWPGKAPELEMFLPSSVLVTGFDIIFFWVARMIMLTHEFTGKVPFREVCITGLIQDAHGNKMSKSKGNIIDPLDLIDGISLDELIKKRTQNLMNPKQAENIATQTAKDYPNGFQAFGADALRFTFAALATHGREIRFDVKRIEGSRNFCNKLWNAGKFVLMNVQQHASLIEDNATNVQNAANLWILNELVRLIGELEFAYATYRFDVLAQKLYEFIWNEFCDWYLELAKVNLISDDVNIRTNTINVLLIVFECSLRLLHPIMPFITEELWQIIASINNKKTAESIMLARYPTIDEIKAEIEAGSDSGSVAGGDNVTDEDRSYHDIKLLKEIITCIRNLRGEMNLNPGLKVPLLIEAGFSDVSYLSDASDMRNKLDDFVPYIQSLAKISEVVFVDDGVDVNGVINSAGSAPVAVVAGVRFMLQVEIDVAQEKIRLKKEIDKNIKESEKINLKLKNSGFLEKAPKDLIERDTARIKELDNIVNHLSVQLSKLT